MAASSNVENLSPDILRQVSKELMDMVKNPLDGISVIIGEEDVTNISATIEGPKDTPYEGGVFKMKLVLGHDFPASPPQGFFVTKIFHPNVASNGAICVNTLKKDWKPDSGIKQILLTVKCLLIYPNPDSALNEEAGRLLQEEYEEYFKRAQMMTSVHAKVGPSDLAQDVQGSSSKDAPSKRKCTEVENAGKKKKDKKGLKRL